MLALAITLASVAPAVRLVAGIAVIPILIGGSVLLYLERAKRRWSFAAAAGLGVLGIGLRLVVNARPDLEVGGGLPLPVTIVYLVLGAWVAATSLLAFRATHRS